MSHADAPPTSVPAIEAAAPSPVPASLLSEALQRSSLGESTQEAANEEAQPEEAKELNSEAGASPPEPAAEGAADGEEAEADHASPHGNEVAATAADEDTQPAESAPVVAEGPAEVTADELVGVPLKEVQCPAPVNTGLLRAK